MRRPQDETGRRLATDTRFSGTVPKGPAAGRLEVPALTLLAHPDPRRVGEMATLPELSSGGMAYLERACWSPEDQPARPGRTTSRSKPRANTAKLRSLSVAPRLLPRAAR